MTRVTILGCGGAGGVPLIGGIWGACDPANPRNRRRRASILVERGDTVLLVDTGPDCRAQLLDAAVSRLDAVLYTHVHADHTHGIDEIRALNRLQHAAIDAYGTEKTLNHLVKKFHYIFDPPGVYEGNPAFYKPCLTARPFTHGVSFDCHGISVLPFAQDHGFVESTGLRFGPVAYSTDLLRLPEDGFKALEGVDTWIVGCLQEPRHPTHAHLGRVLRWIARVGCRRAVLTHLSHRLDYDALSKLLPANVTAAHDGMVLTCDDDAEGEVGDRTEALTSARETPRGKPD